MRSLVVVLGAGLAVSACVSAAEIAQQQQNLLAAAGFVAKPANTPERIAALHAMPPRQVLMQAHEGHFVYLYADPDFCRCLYVGDAQAYQRFRQEEFQLRLAGMRQQTALMYQSAAMNWGLWGPWPWGPW